MNNKKEMTSRERVLATFNHKEPDRVPMWCGASEEFWLKAKKATGLSDEELFRRFVLPHLKSLIDLGHSYGLKVMMHCCGGFAQLIPSLIEVGLDGLHAVQTSCSGMDLPTLKARFGDKIVFNGGIDSHHILIKGDPDYVSHKTCEILKIMMPGGGYIGGASHDTILEETPLENVLAMFDTIREYGVY